MKVCFEGLGLTKEVNRLRFEFQSLLIDLGFRVKLRFEAFKVQGSRFGVKVQKLVIETTTES